jgi:putative nucleotidyltransferase with HDIG domain
MTNEQGYSVTPVGSTDYVISRASDRVLVAHLGTCVGVTLCDPRANVGGLIHLLLPEPTNCVDPWRPTAYAAIGLPLFIEGLCAAGGRKERMEACIAGGSLVAPLSGSDLILDIGGRTAEVVERILNRKKVYIRKSEIGGCSPRVLSLNLRTWESRIEPIGPPPPASIACSFEAPSHVQIEAAIERVLPIPQVALKIIRMAHDHACALKDIAGEIMQDQVISARVLKLCNSIIFGSRARIDSIEKALMRLGETHIVRIVLATTVEDFLSLRSEHGYSLCKGGLFDHALRTAKVCQHLARLTRGVSPDLAYTAGLLHDIGKVVLDQYMCEAYPLFYRKTRVEGMELVTVEQELFGVSHPEVGKRLAQRWFFPDNLTEAIRHHHSPEMAETASELCHIVYLANLIVSRFVVGQELERTSASALEAALQRIGLGPEQFPHIVDRVSEELSGNHWSARPDDPNDARSNTR